AFLTNPVPDPSFPWATLPAAWRLPVEQPRIEHWPVTYTVGIWLWVLFAPSLVLAGWRRYRRLTPLASTAWLVWTPAVAMLALTSYCRFLWPKLSPPTWNAPAYTFVCWGYCATYDPLWSSLAYGIALVGVLAGVLALLDRPGARYWIGAFGILSLPLGLPALYAAAHSSATTAPAGRA
ncbi:MAG: hypothetical protein ABEJ92_10890, partial [Halobacteriales archaeon]